MRDFFMSGVNCISCDSIRASRPTFVFFLCLLLPLPPRFSFSLIFLPLPFSSFLFRQSLLPLHNLKHLLPPLHPPPLLLHVLPINPILNSPNIPCPALPQ